MSLSGCEDCKLYFKGFHEFKVRFEATKEALKIAERERDQARFAMANAFGTSMPEMYKSKREIELEQALKQIAFAHNFASLGDGMSSSNMTNCNCAAHQRAKELLNGEAV